MLPDRRAVVFDLDDTLYPYRRFVLSGFAAVAAHLAARRAASIARVGVPRAGARLARPARGREIQVCLEHWSSRRTCVAGARRR